MCIRDRLGRHVLARPAGALVDHKDAVCHRVSFLQSDAAFRERAQNRRLRPRDAARDAGPGRRGMAAAAQALADGRRVIRRFGPKACLLYTSCMVLPP